MAGDFAEISLRFASIAMALGSASFAIHMNTSEERWITVSSALRLPTGAVDRPAGSLAEAAVEAEATDDLVTGAITSLGSSASAGLSTQRFQGAPASASYRVIAVVGSKAYLESGRGTSLSVIAVERGSLLPGAGRVLAIDTRAGRWVVETTKLTITSSSAP